MSDSSGGQKQGHNQELKHWRVVLDKYTQDCIVTKKGSFPNYFVLKALFFWSWLIWQSNKKEKNIKYFQKHCSKCELHRAYPFLSSSQSFPCSAAAVFFSLLLMAGWFSILCNVNLGGKKNLTLKEREKTALVVRKHIHGDDTQVNTPPLLCYYLLKFVQF